MKINQADRASAMTQKNRRKKIWHRAIGVMASVVVFCTTYALILPAITLTENYYCGLEEHTHTDDCYRSQAVKTNACSAKPHRHTSSCYGSNGDCICGLADFFIHTHDDICYDDTGRLVCELPEISFHQHTSECYLGENIYSCGMVDYEGHVHTDDCYVDDRVMTCGLSEQDPHLHDESCYEMQNVLICTQEECDGHMHLDSCYLEGTVLSCGLENDPEHVHEDGCYVENHTLICSLQETDGHLHTDACYTQEQIFVCSYEEGGGHIHSEECYSMLPKLVCTMENGAFHMHTEDCQLISEPVLVCGQYDMIFGEHSPACMDENGRVVCGQMSVTEHIHTEECFVTEEEQTEPVLICELDEHTHELICTSDKTADLETAEIWRTTLPEEDELTGILAEDLLTVAKSQLGYQESERNFEVTDDGIRKGYSRYGQWYGTPYGDWCAMYVSFCLHYTNISKDVVPYEASCQNWVDKLTELELYYPAQDYEPVPGDIIFFGTSEKSSYHVGLVTEILEEEVKTIEGNHSIDVAEYTYEQTDPIIMGYGSIEAIQKRGIELGLLKPYDVLQLEADYGDIRIRLLAPADAFPVTAENLTLAVKDPDETIKAHLQENMGDEQEYFAVDIQILCDGEPIQPHGDVQVIFEMKHDPFPNADAVDVFHVVEDEDGLGLDMQQVEGGYDGNGDVVMETNHFSTYVVKAASAPIMLAAAGSLTNTWNEALTDRSPNVGVTTEGYADSPYDVIAESKGWMYALGQVTSNNQEANGGTVILKHNLQLNEEYWDGEQPFRITSADPSNPRELTLLRDDWFLENTHAPQAALKIDNVKLLSTLKYVNIWGRGNKIVIGENVWVNPDKTTRVWGGSDNSNTTTNYPTNVVVLSADWDYVCGGGRKNIPAGTTVTIGGTANVGTLYGGGMENSTVGTPNGENTDVNIFIEGGTVGTLYGGNLVQDRNDAIYEDINIEVSAGHVGILYAGNDYSEMEAGDAEGSFVQGTATVRLTNTGSATRVLGDPYHSAYTRSIKGAAILEVYCNEEFDLMDYWDVVRITGNGSANSTNVSTAQTTGGDYIGRMEVTNGGRLYLKQNGYINILNEADGVLTPQNVGSTPYDLKHAWQGESTEDRRNLSTLAIEGAAITPSGSYYFDQNAGSAGLRIKGNVEGFSTLEACGTPMYSTGDTYYYYVVADSSDNDGKAFREPEGAPYVVCYRYLEDGRIGWYLRERPVLTMTNSLVRVGTEGTLTPTDNGFYSGCPSNYVIMHVDMKGFAYEWSNTPGKNRVEFEWSIFDGYENASQTIGGISLETMADVENNIYSTSNPNGIFANVEYNAMGTDEGSTTLSERVSSFYVIIDTSKAVNPRYYEVSTSFHYTRGEDDYDDLRVGQAADAARCTYDFDNPNNDIEDLPTDGYSDSIMTTYEYNDGIPPKGADDALLRVYLPEGVSANTLTVKELDGNFTFKETGISASLVANAQVNQYYETEEEPIYNHQFGVTLQQTGESEVDLAGGATLYSLSSKESYHCAVYSHKKVGFTDITPESELGLQLQLQLNSLTKDGNAVGIGDPSAVNDGELRIQVLPVGTIIDTTKISVEKRVTGATEGHTAEFDFLLSYPKVDANGNSVTHEERFTLKHGEVQTLVVPVDTKITVQEIKHDGYYVQAHVQGEGGDAPYTDTITVTPDKTPGNENPTKVIFYNTAGAELPDSGGFGTQFHTLLGLLLTLGAFLFLWIHRRKGGTVS